jgi:DNA-binding transcriptional regulator YiaG
MLELTRTVSGETSPQSRTRPTPQVRPQRAANRFRDLDKKKIKYRKRRADGLCAYGYCPEKAEPGHAQCQRHLQKMRARAIERRKERIAEGICISCGERPQFWGLKCILCRTVRSNNPLPYGARRALRLHREAEEKRHKLEVQREVREVALQLLTSNQFPGKSAEALRLYAGFDNGQWRTYRQVGQLMNLSGERVRQMILPLKRRLEAERTHCVPNATRKRNESGIPRTTATRSSTRCSSCDIDASRILKDGSYSYMEPGLPKVVLLGLNAYRCKACNQKAVSICRKTDLHGLLAKAVLRKPGLLTGAEARFLRVFAVQSTSIFAEELGVTTPTLLAWERAERLRYRDDLCVRIISAALSRNEYCSNNTFVVARAIRETNTEPYEIRAVWNEDEKRWLLMSSVE